MTPEEIVAQFTELITEDNPPDLGEEIYREDRGVGVVVAFDGERVIARTKEEDTTDWHMPILEKILREASVEYDWQHHFYWWCSGNSYRRPALLREIVEATS